MSNNRNEIKKLYDFIYHALIALVVLASCSGVSYAGDNLQLGTILDRLAEQEGKLGSLRFNMTEHITDYIDPNANVSKKYFLEEQGSNHRVDINFLDLSKPPRLPGRDDNSTYAYLDTQTAFDGSIMTQHIPSALLGIIGKERFSGQFDRYPVSNIRPFSPNSRQTLRDFIVEQTNQPNASIDVIAGDRGGHVEIKIEYGRRQRRLLLNPSKGYSLIESWFYFDDRLTEHRSFSDFQEKDGVWLATKSRIELFHSKTKDMGKLHLCLIDDDWEVNVPIPPKRFNITFPEKIIIQDNILSTSYINDTQEVLERNLDTAITSSLKDGVGKPEIPSTTSTSSNANIDTTKPANHQNDGINMTASVGSSPGLYDWWILTWKPLISLFAIITIGATLLLLIRKKYLSVSKVIRYILATILMSLFIINTIYLYSTVKFGRIGPGISVETSTINLGTISAENTAIINVVVKNIGTRALQITDIKKSCSCSKASMSKMVIPSGKEEVLKIEYQPRKGILDNFKTSVYLHSNDLLQPSVGIKILGRSVPIVEMDPSFIDIGTIRRSTTKIANVKLFDPHGDRLSVAQTTNFQIDKELSIHKAERFSDPDGRTGLLLTLAVSPLQEGRWRQKKVLPLNSRVCKSATLDLGGTVNDKINTHPSLMTIDTSKSTTKSINIILNGLPFDSKQISIDIKPKLLDVQLYRCDYDKKSSILKARLLPETMDVAKPLGGKIIISSKETNKTRPLKTIPFIVR